MNKILMFFAVGLLTGTTAFAQDSKKTKESVPNNWYQLDPKESGYRGISLEKAHSYLKSTKLKSNRVIVAVIDSGIDTTHEDLKPVLWVNEKEIPGNGIDDDRNGYVDDVHGWNFIGGKDGRNVKEDSYEASRVYHALKTKWDGKDVDESTLSAADKKEYQTYVKAKNKATEGVNEQELAFMRQVKPGFEKGDSVIRKELGKEEYNCNDLKNYKSTNKDATVTKSILMSICNGNGNMDISNTMMLDDLKSQIRKGDEATAPPPAYRGDIVKDNEKDINDRFYGNNDQMASTPFHGSFCAGIIAAVRGNNEKLDGIADNVRIMAIRAVPDGDEHDKDVALAIKYAVDNGAKVINMSFGKDFSPQKKWVDEAFRYAESKGVLLVHAAGNDNKDIDTEDNFPSANFENGSRAGNIITVGASGDEKNGGLTASFSNFGRKEVDVFAPGVQIYSTTPHNNSYGKSQGTSFAGPIVAGIAALILQYYPALTPQQVKMAIEKSTPPTKEMVNKPGTDEKVSMKELCRAGGIVNAYEAAKYAGTIKAGKTEKTKLPKTKIRKEAKG